MKILINTDAFIKGKLYKEGSSIPKEYEKEFEQYLVETDPSADKAGISYPKVDPLRPVCRQGRIDGVARLDSIFNSRQEASETNKSVETKTDQVPDKVSKVQNKNIKRSK